MSSWNLALDRVADRVRSQIKTTKKRRRATSAVGAQGPSQAYLQAKNDWQVKDDRSHENGGIVIVEASRIRGPMEWTVHGAIEGVEGALEGHS